MKANSSMSKYDVQNLRVRLGDHNIKDGSYDGTTVEKRVKRVIRHKGFSSSTLVSHTPGVLLMRYFTVCGECSYYYGFLLLEYIIYDTIINISPEIGALGAQIFLLTIDRWFHFKDFCYTKAGKCPNFG